MAVRESLPSIDLEESTTLCETRKSSTLLNKYNIPINYLDFDYINKCTNGREMEKIYHILLSGEEGHFPALLKTAEEKLKKLVPKSKFLRKSVPILTKHTVGENEWKSIVDDVEDWVTNISKNDKELSSMKSVPVMTDAKIRQSVKIDGGLPKQSNKNRIKSTDYASWDKFDPDTEILKQDLEEKRIIEQAKNINKTSVNTKRKASVKFKETVTNAEAIFNASNEKDKGNEYFKVGEYEDALDHYSRSISINPTAAAYNNRAITYIKLKNFSNAVTDCDEALDREPFNVKALIRKAQAFEALDFFEDALKSVEKAITIEPNNCLAQNMANSIRQKCTRKFEKSRMLIHDIEESIKQTEMKQKEKASKETIVETQSKKQQENKIVAVSGKYSKPTSKERHSHAKTVENETVVLPIPGSSRSSPPFYKIVKKNTVAVELKRINNRPRILHIPTIYHENTDEEEELDDNRSPFNENLTRKRGVQITELIDEAADEHSMQNRSGSGSNDNCSRNNKSPTEEEEDIFTTPGAGFNEKEENAIVDEFDSSQTSFTASTECSPREISLIDIETKVKRKLQEEQLPEDFHNTLINFGQSDSVLAASIARQQRVASDLKGGGDTLCRDNEVPLSVETPYGFISSWGAFGKDPTYSQQAQILENVDARRLAYIIGCKLDGDMLSGIICCMARHFTVPDKLDKVAQILEALVQVPRFRVVLMFLNDNDLVALRRLIEFLEQHGRSLSQELKENLQGF